MLLKTMTEEELVEEMARDQPEVEKVERKLRKKIKEEIKRNNKRTDFGGMEGIVTKNGNKWHLICVRVNAKYSIVRVCEMFNGRNISYILYTPNSSVKYKLISSHAISRFRERSGLPEWIKKAPVVFVIYQMFTAGELMIAVQANRKDLVETYDGLLIDLDMENPNYILYTLRGGYIIECTSKGVIFKTYLGHELFMNNETNKYAYMLSYAMHVDNNKMFYKKEDIELSQRILDRLSEKSEVSAYACIPSPFMKASGRDLSKDYIVTGGVMLKKGECKILKRGDK